MKQLCGLMIIAIAYLIAEVVYSATVKAGDLITQATMFRLGSAYEHATEWHRQRPNI